MKSLIDVNGLSAAQIVEYLDRAEAYRGKRTAELANVAVATLFFEPSTRTRLSFELAATRLGAELISFDHATSSASKGESFKDTAMTIVGLGAQVIVVRHNQAGSADLAAKWTGLPVVNAGDGRRAHPTQTLLDLLTIRSQFGRIEGIDVAVVGDIMNSRVARGLINTLPRLGARVTVIGPGTLVASPTPWSVDVSRDLDSVLGRVDVVFVLRVQKERGAGQGYPSDPAYYRRFGMTPDREAGMKPGAVIMHPGPINRGIEIASEVADGPRSRILEQVRNGVPIRMAVLASAYGDPS